MLQAMFSGVSGLQVHQTKLDVIGNNIANVNTLGFKAGRVTFEDQLSQTLRSSSAPGESTGGQNPAQVGLGVVLGAVDTIQSQGNLQTTGKQTDMAIQGNGFFLVGSGNDTFYTRDGSFDLDSSGALVNPANGLKLLGYVADSHGVIDTTQPVKSDSVLRIKVGSDKLVKASTQAKFAGNLDASSSVQTTKTTFDGNITSDPKTITSTVYDPDGTAHTIGFSLSGKTAAAGTDTWVASLSVDGTNVAGGPYNMTFDSATGALTGSSLPTTTSVGSGASAFNVALNYATTLTDNGATDTIKGTSNGNSGPSPIWQPSLTVYDSLGTPHNVSVKFTRQPLGTTPTPPGGATSRWDWQASENGNVLSTSASAGNAPLYFDTSGNLMNTKQQGISLVSTDPAASPLNISLDFNGISQLASGATSGKSGSDVAVISQDGYPTGTLEAYKVSQDGLIEGTYTNGQSKVLGQIATAAFSNPSGLDKEGNNLFKSSSNSGLAQVGKPQSNGRGKINTGFVEMSNVDLSTEFTNLIVTQRGFQANTRIITIVDDMLQDVINLKR